MIAKVKKREEGIVSLRARSPYYPEWIEEKNGDVIVLSTLVRKRHEHTWYTIHLVSEGIGEGVLRMFIYDAYIIAMFHKPFLELDKIDSLQIDESERLVKLKQNDNV